MSDPILIAGLPGSGKSRWIAAQTEPSRLVEWHDDALPAGRAIWWGMDLRQPPHQRIKTLLRPCLQRADALIGFFAEESPIETQLRWREFLAPLKKSGTPLYFSHFLQAPPPDFPTTSAKAACSCRWPQRRTVCVQLPMVVLDHLLFVIQGLAQSTPMRFWRIKGVVQTLEYVNAVAVEGSLTGLYTHAAGPEDGPAGRLTMQVENLELERLSEALRAVRAPGQDLDICIISE